MVPSFSHDRKRSYRHRQVERLQDSIGFCTMRAVGRWNDTWNAEEAGEEVDLRERFQPPRRDWYATM